LLLLVGKRDGWWSEILWSTIAIKIEAVSKNVPIVVRRGTVTRNPHRILRRDCTKDHMNSKGQKLSTVFSAGLGPGGRAAAWMVAFAGAVSAPQLLLA
jgi:hypothetical protein